MADLSLTITHSPDPAVGLQQLIYTVHIANAGPGFGASLRVLNTLPPGSVFVSAGGVDWDCRDPVDGVVTCYRGLLPAGASASPLGIAVIPPAEGGTFSNRAGVTDLMGIDPDLSNDFATESVLVTAAPPVSFYTVSPCRIVDTRGPVADTGGPALLANTGRKILLTGPNAPDCGVPSDARAVAVNATVVDPSDGGDLRLHAGGTSLPGSSTINFVAGQVRANSAVVPLVDGFLSVQCDMVAGSRGTVHFILDVSGYFR